MTSTTLWKQKSWLGLTLALLFFAVACESKTRKKADSKPETVPEKRSEVTKPAKSAPTKSKLPPGHVVFSVQNADLKTAVLPLFLKQVGVSIVWRDEPRKVSLNFIEPIPWRSALDLLCRFYSLEYRQEGPRILLYKKGDAVSAFNFNNNTKSSSSPGIKSTVNPNGRAPSSSSGGSSSSSNNSGASGLRDGLNKVDSAIDRRTKKRQNP